MTRPPILIRYVRDRRAWRRELIGLASDLIDWVEDLGRRFIMTLGK